MHTHKNSPLFGFLSIGLLAVLLISGCGAGNAEPTIAPEAIFTSAFETFSAKMATDQAAVTPTLTAQPLPSPSPFPSFAPIPSLPSAAFASSTPSSGAASTAGCENDSTWIADVTVPDGTVFTPGEDFNKTWRVQNTGTCTWTTKYTVQFRDGTEMFGKEAFLPMSIPPGQQGEVTVRLEAPDDEGSFYGRWELHDPDDKSFGSFLTIVIKVAGTALQ